MGHCKSSTKGKVHSNTSLPQETKKKSKINNQTLHLKQLEKEEMKNPRVSRRKELLKNSGRKKCKINKRDHSKNHQSENQQGQKLVL